MAFIRGEEASALVGFNSGEGIQPLWLQWGRGLELLPQCFCNSTPFCTVPSFTLHHFHLGRMGPRLAESEIF